jgi:hypothetical protein
MRPRSPVAPLRAVAVPALLSLLATGCGHSQGPPAIRAGSPCAGCGMEVHDLRFACERPVAGTWRVYDAIECLIRDAAADTGAAPGARAAWLADYDRQSLHPADSLWVVRGSFPSPMGDGFAAFLSRSAADSIAATTEGRVERLRTWLVRPPAPDHAPAEPDHAPAEPDTAPATPDHAPAEPAEASP